MQPLGSEHMGLHAPEERIERRAARTDLVRQRRRAQRHAFAGVALGLPVQPLSPKVRRLHA
jgi:hypothetical protein